MQIFIKDPITGQITTSCEPPPEQVSLKQQDTGDQFWNDMINSITTHNQLMHTLIESFWSLNSEQFSHTWNDIHKQYIIYRQSSNKNDDNTSLVNIDFEFKKSFITKFIESLDDKKNKKILKHHVEKIFSIWKLELNPDVFPAILWQIDLKKQSLKILESYSCDLNEEQYLYFYNSFSKNIRDQFLPLEGNKKNNILDEEKSNFLQIQKQYCTFKKLNDKLTYKNIKTKHIKI